MGLGINPKVIGSAVNVVMAQRLVRQLCPHCKKEVPIEGDDKKAVESVLGTIFRKEIIPEKQDIMWTAAGCKECSSIGYKGRIGLYEAILIDEAIADIVTKDPSPHEIEQAAHTQGILSIRQDGILKVLRGITSLSEVERVIAIDADAEPKKGSV